MRSQLITVQPGTLPDNNGLCFVARASDKFGGFTVVNAYAVTGAVGTLDLVLQNYGSSGTVAGGTVASMSSGTATVWAADTPQELTLSTTLANRYMDADEWLVLKKTESAAGNDLSDDATVVIEVVPGVVDAG